MGPFGIVRRGRSGFSSQEKERRSKRKSEMHLADSQRQVQWGWVNLFSELRGLDYK